MVQSVIGYRDSHMFLKEEFEAYGSVTVATEDGSVGTKGNVLDAIRENDLKADVIYACGPTPMLRALKAYRPRKKASSAIYPWKRKWPAALVPVWHAPARQRMWTNIPRYITSVSVRIGPVFLAEDIEL